MEKFRPKQPEIVRSASEEEILEDGFELIEPEKVETKGKTLESGEPIGREEGKNEKIQKIREKIAVQTNSNPPKMYHETRMELEEVVAAAAKRSKWVAPALFKGNKTATEYDSKVTNYSTQTSIVELSDGNKYFVVNNYSLSFIHRALDGFMKKVTGCRMAKASSSEWKSRFEKRSMIPTIPNENPDTVVMPFIPNVNLFDLFANRDSIGDFGECEFAKDIDQRKALEIISKVSKQVKGVHDGGITWGELILPNIIIDSGENVHICDPETMYDEGVELSEQKARDLLDLITSSAATLFQKENIDYSVTVKNVLDTYGDSEVISELKALCAKKPGLLSKMFFGYTKVRLGLKDQEEMMKIREAITNYQN